MLYKVIHQVYRVEANSIAEAKKKAEDIVKHGQIRVEPLESKQSFLGMLIRGPK